MQLISSDIHHTDTIEISPDNHFEEGDLISNFAETEEYIFPAVNIVSTLFEIIRDTKTGVIRTPGGAEDMYHQIILRGRRDD
jgi:hypothetical protein